MQSKDSTRSLIIGGTGVVGSHIVKLSAGKGLPFALSRKDQSELTATWIKGDLLQPEQIDWPDVDVVHCTASARLLADALPYLAQPTLKRVVLFTTTSISTKAGSKDPEERVGIEAYAEAEKDVIRRCNELGVSWTILRPTMIYDEGRDLNVTRIARLINRIGFFPLCGLGQGLRQPVHAEDCGRAALDAAKAPGAANEIYDLPGGEILTYRELIGRIFDGLNRPRRIFAVPPSVWMAALHLAGRSFPGVNASMGARMAKDMTFDFSTAVADFNWSPRAFKPRFVSDRSGRVPV
jgi:nucleoside-diphosphate-sugar epimerase